MKILVTGCLGFIGSHFVKYTLKHFPGVKVTGFSRFSSSKHLLRIDDIAHDGRFNLCFGDLAGDISGLLEGVDVVVNFAAKTFVDHSIKDPEPFIHSNILGTYNLLEQCRRYPPKLYVQISTDEVYGSIEVGAHNELSPLNPTNPYSSSKAAADMLVMSYGSTYGLPYIITRTENNYGPFQHPQKVMPAFVKKALNGEPLPIYGDGKHKRMWLRVEDHCSAVWHLINKDLRGIYHIAGEQELDNTALARKILIVLGKPESLLTFIDDSKIRPGHDRRYALDVSKLRATGWTPQWSLNEGLADAILWYKENQRWLE